MDLSIIIPSKERSLILHQTLEKAYRAIEHTDAEIIVINDSKTQEIGLVPGWTDRIKVFNNPKSGVASARNLGADKARAELLLFMDDDMWISADNINVILHLHQHLGIKGCINLNWVYPSSLIEQMKATQFGRYLHTFGFDSLEGWRRGTTWNSEKIFPVEGITSQNLSIKKSDFRKAGGYNENFPHAGFEDHDFSIRLSTAGIQPYIYPLSIMYHNEADRMEVKAWLARKRRGGETRRVAVKMGHEDLKLNYGVLKSSVYKILMPLQPAFYSLLSAIPNIRLFDPFYFKILNKMLGTALFEGYYKSNNY